MFVYDTNSRKGVRCLFLWFRVSTVLSLDPDKRDFGVERVVRLDGTYSFPDPVAYLFPKLLLDPKVVWNYSYPPFSPCRTFHP